MGLAYAPISLPSLPRATDRLTFLYAEHCVVHRKDNAITLQNEKGTVHVPASTLLVLMLGPGASVSHQALLVMSECGSTVVWVGESGVRYYAHGRSLAQSNRLLVTQAYKVSHRRERLEVARRMYEMRFSTEDVASLTMQQLRGREGARMRRLYREQSKQTGVPWSGRRYNPDDFLDADPVNQALSVANTCLYGVVHAVICALGCSPGLGFVHQGHEKSFVYDIADLYKAEISIPLAFRIAAEDVADIPAITRRRMRDTMFSNRVVERCVHDIQSLLGVENQVEYAASVVTLWDYQNGMVEAGVNYMEGAS